MTQRSTKSNLEMKATSSVDKSEDKSFGTIVPMASALPISYVQKRRRTVSDQSSQVLDTSELLQEILAKLPPKTVFGLTTVSKHWNRISTDPQLIPLLKVPQNPTAIFLRRFVLHNDVVKFTHIPLERVTRGGGAKAIRLTTVSLNLFEEERFTHVPFVIEHSCHGLMICSSSDVPRCYFLYNPTTKKGVRIPELTNLAVMSMHISFQAPCTYKIIAVCLPRKSQRLQLHVLESNQSLLHWRNTGVEFPVFGLTAVNYGYGVCMDGVIYWPCYKSSGLMFFNLREETLQWLPEVPQPYNHFSGIAYFGECKGNLRMVLYDSMRGATFDMLELKTDLSMWFIKYYIDLRPRARSADHMLTLPILVLALLPGEEEEDDSYLIVHIPREVVSYNLKDGTIKKLCNLGLRPPEWHLLRNDPWDYVHPHLQNPLYPTLTA